MSVRPVRRFAALVLAGALTIAAGACGSSAERPAQAASDTVVPTASIAVQSGPVLPVPEALPDLPYAASPGGPIGTIEIPALGLSADLQQGMTLTAIDRGPSWWPGTAMPGQLGNVVVAGHRTTHSKPFAHLDALVPGDQVIFTTSAGRFVYQVRGVIVVPGDWIDIAAQSPAHTATLFACHPPGSASQRIVAKLELLGTDGQPADAEADLPPLDAEAQHTDHTLYVRSPSSRDATGGDQSADDPLAGSRG